MKAPDLKIYVLGFLFSPDGRQVVLIRKQKPDWQKGKLNGIGGKVGLRETSLHAMTREFTEEAGNVLLNRQWSSYACLQGHEENSTDEFIVYCFAAVGDVTQAHTVEAECIEVVDFNAVSALTNQMIENLPWLLHLAYDYLHDGRPAFAVITYP